jgi:hypothetical protein
MNGIFQMQGGKNWILPKEMVLLGLSLAGYLVKPLFFPLWDPMEEAWLWTQSVSHHFMYADSQTDIINTV